MFSRSGSGARRSVVRASRRVCRVLRGAGGRGGVGEDGGGSEGVADELRKVEMLTLAQI